MTKPGISITPHDAFFKRSLQDLQTARHLLQRYLPKKALAMINLETLEACKVEHVDKDLKKSACDVVLKVKTINNELAYVYILVEQQRSPEKTMPFRILQYMLHIMDEHLRIYKTNTLPLVLPLIIYNGDRTYPYSMDIFDLFAAEHQEQARATFVTPYTLVDLNHENTEAMADDPWVSLLLNALKYAPRKTQPEVIVNVLELAIIYLAQHEELDLVHTALRYVYEVKNEEDEQALWEGFRVRLQPILGDNFMMTIADKFRQEGMHQGIQQGMHQGIQQGMQQGIHQGMQEGRQEGMQLVAKNLLKNGLDVDFVAKNTGLAVSFLRDLEKETKH